jgi:hypothetical protein
MTLKTQEFLLLKQLAYPDPISIDSMAGDIGRAYTKAVREYTTRSLTYEEDRLDAFTGVLNVFAAGHYSVLETRTLSGLLDLPEDGKWSRWRCFSLSWVIPGKSHRIRYNKSKSRLLPSWSWVGWSGKVKSMDNIVEKSYKSLSIMNETNIRVDMEISEPWPYEPIVCDSTLKQGVVLHLWAPVLRCRLVLDGPEPGLAETHHRYSVLATDLPFQADLG